LRKKILLTSLILICINLSLFGKELIDKCYVFSKSEFILIEDRMIKRYLEKEIKLKSNILLEFKKDEEIGTIGFLSLKKPYLYNQGGIFSCYFNQNNYSCSQDDDGGNFTLKIKDNKPYLYVEYARLADNPDVPIMQNIKSKGKINTYTQGQEIKCKSK
jgi:hypothetical protein